MGLFASIDNFFKDYSSIVFHELDYSSGNIDVSKTTYLRRDNIFLENAIYYNQLRYKLVNKAFEINEHTFSQGITRIPIKQLIDIKTDSLTDLKNDFTNKHYSVAERYLDILKFRTVVIETLLSGITFAAYSGDIDRSLSLVEDSINNVCKQASNCFSGQITELQGKLKDMAQKLTDFSKIGTYAEYTLAGDSLLSSISESLSDIAILSKEMLYLAATGKEPDGNTVLTDALIETKYENPYEGEYHSIILPKTQALGERVTAKLSVPEESFTGYRTWSDTLYLELVANEDVIVENGNETTPIIVQSASDLSIDNPKINLGDSTDSENDANSIFFKLANDINLSDVDSVDSSIVKIEGSETKKATIGNSAYGIYIDLNGYKLTINSQKGRNASGEEIDIPIIDITIGTAEVDEDSEDISGTVNISNGEIYFEKEMITGSNGKFEGDPLKIKIKGGSSISTTTIAFEENTKGIFDLDKLRKRDILEIDLSQGSSFTNSVLNNVTDYGMIFAGKYPRVVINEKVSDITLENIHGNNVNTLHNKHLIFKISFPVTWSSVGNVSTGSRGARKLVNNDLSIGTDGDEDTKIFSNDGGKVVINYSQVKNILHLAKNTQISAFPLYYIRDNGNNMVFSSSDEEAISDCVVLGENGKTITFIQFNMLKTSGSKVSEGLFHFEYEDGSIMTEYIRYSSENADIKNYFYKSEGLSELDEIGDTAEKAIDDVQNLLNPLVPKKDPDGNDLRDENGNIVYFEPEEWIEEFFEDFKEDMIETISDAIVNIENSIQSFESIRVENVKKALQKFSANVDILNGSIVSATCLDERRASEDPNYTDQFIQDILNLFKEMKEVVATLYDGSGGMDQLELAAHIAVNGASSIQKSVKDVNSIQTALSSGISIEELKIADVFLQKKTDVLYKLDEYLEQTHSAINTLLTRVVDTHCELIDIIDQYSVNMQINRTDVGFIGAVDSFLKSDKNLLDDSSATYISKFSGRNVRSYDEWARDLETITGTQPIYETVAMYVISELGIMAGRISPANIHSSKKKYHGEILLEILNRSILLIARKGLWRNFISEEFRTALENEEYLYRHKGLRVSRYFMYDNVDSVILTLFPKIREFNDYDLLGLMHSQKKYLNVADFNECKFIFQRQLLNTAKDPNLLNDLVASAMDGFNVEKRSIRTRLLEGPFYSALWDFFFVSYNSVLNDDNINRLLKYLLSKKNVQDINKTIIYHVKFKEDGSNKRILMDSYEFLAYTNNSEQLKKYVTDIKKYVNDQYQKRITKSSNQILEQFYLDYSDGELTDTVARYLDVYIFYYDSQNSLATYLSTDLILERIPYYNIIEGNIDYKRGVYELSNKALVQITNADMINDDEIYYYYRKYTNSSYDRFIKLEFYKDNNGDYKIPISAGDITGYVGKSLIFQYNEYLNENRKFLIDYFVDYRNRFINEPIRKDFLALPPLCFKMYESLKTSDNDSHGGNADAFKYKSESDGVEKQSYLQFRDIKDLGYLAPPFMGKTQFPEQYNMEYYMVCVKAYVMNEIIFKKFCIDNDDFNKWLTKDTNKIDEIRTMSFPIYKYGTLDVRGVVVTDNQSDIFRTYVYIDNLSQSVIVLIALSKKDMNILGIYNDSDINPVWTYKYSGTSDISEEYAESVYDELIDYFQISGLTQKISSIEKYFVAKYIEALYKISTYEKTENDDSIKNQVNIIDYNSKKIYYGNLSKKVDESNEYVTLTEKYTDKIIGGVRGTEIRFLELVYDAAKSILPDDAKSRITTAFNTDDGKRNSVVFKETEGSKIYTMMESNIQPYLDNLDAEVEDVIGDILANNYFAAGTELIIPNYTDSGVSSYSTILKPVLSTTVSGIMYKYIVEKYLSGNGNVDLFRNIPNIYNTGFSRISDFTNVYACNPTGDLGSVIDSTRFNPIKIFSLPVDMKLTKELYKELSASTDTNTDTLKYYVSNKLIYRGVFKRVQFSRISQLITYPDIGSAMDSLCSAIRTLNRRDGNSGAGDENDKGLVDNGIVVAVDNRMCYDRSLLMKNLGRSTIDEILEAIAPVTVPENFYAEIKNPYYGISTNSDDKVVKTIKKLFDNAEDEDKISVVQKCQINNWFMKHETFYYFVDIYKITGQVSPIGRFNVDENAIIRFFNNIFGQNEAVSIMFEDSVLAINGFGIFSAVPFMIVDKNKSQTDIERIGFQIDDRWLDLTDIYNLDLYTRKDYLRSGLDIIAALTNVDNIGYGLYNEYLNEFQTDNI